MGDFTPPTSESESSSAGTLRPSSSLPCFVCGRNLEAVYWREPWQPHNAVMCEASGNYGSTLYDTEPGTLIFNVCDDCLAGRADRVRQRVPRRRVEAEHNYVVWTPSAAWLKARDSGGRKADPEERERVDA